MSVGFEVLNLGPKLFAWRICEAGEGEKESTGEDKSTPHIFSVGINFSLLTPGSLCTPQRCMVMPCMVHCSHLHGKVA